MNYLELRYGKVLEQCQNQVNIILYKIYDKDNNVNFSYQLATICQKGWEIVELLSTKPSVLRYSKLTSRLNKARNMLMELNTAISEFNKSIHKSLGINVKVLFLIVFLLENVLDNNTYLYLMMILNLKQLSEKDIQELYDDIYVDLNINYDVKRNINDVIFLDEGYVQSFTRDVLIPVIESELYTVKLSENLKNAMLNFTGNEEVDRTKFTKNVKL